MVKIYLKGTYLGTTTPTSLQNEVSACWKIVDDKDTRVIFNQSVNEY